jgi:hypothetical protein
VHNGWPITQNNHVMGDFDLPVNILLAARDYPPSRIACPYAELPVHVIGKLKSQICVNIRIIIIIFAPVISKEIR